MTNFIQVLIEGGLVGLVYGLVAISFVVIYRASRIVNLAQGEVLVFGALFLWTFTLGLRSIGFQVPLVVGIAITLAACIAFGLVLERFVFRPLISQPAFSIFMASIALLSAPRIDRAVDPLVFSQSGSSDEIVESTSGSMNPRITAIAINSEGINQRLVRKESHRLISQTCMRTLRGRWRQPRFRSTRRRR